MKGNVLGDAGTLGGLVHDVPDDLLFSRHVGWQPASVLAWPIELDPSANLLRQRLSCSSCTVSNQAFREAFRDDVFTRCPKSSSRWYPNSFSV
jgi:hypothetical protein